MGKLKNIKFQLLNHLQINGEEATIKKAYKTNLGIELKAINPYYPPRIFTKEEIKTIPIKIIGVVKHLKRDF